MTDNESAAKKIKFTQSTLDNTMPQKWDINDKRSLAITYAIGDMIAVDNRPFSVAEDLGFIRVLNKAQPKYKVSNVSV